jgi:hypothetical protein
LSNYQLEGCVTREGDARVSEVYEPSDRTDVVYKEIVLPTDLAGRDDMAGTQDHSILCNAAEHAGLRRNSRKHHAHLLMTPRGVTLDALGPRTCKHESITGVMSVGVSTASPPRSFLRKSFMPNGNHK